MAAADALPDRFDYLLVGGGLQNGLIASALLRRDPDASIALVERSERLGGNHTWCFHSDDVPDRARPFVDPLVRHRWPGYRVLFPGGERRLETPYACIPSEHFHRVVVDQLHTAPGCVLFTGVEAEAIRESAVRLSDGRTLAASVVIDARGPGRPTSATGFQKFVGLELDLDRPHGMTEPILMNATVDQTDGFRFLYTLPLGERRLLVEDTFFSDSPELDRPALRETILAHVRESGWGQPVVVREEEGVLPMPWKGRAPRFARQGPLAAGYGGGWFHPATGYSFPCAVELALHVASTPAADLFGSAYRALVKRQRAQMRYCHLLNRMLFRWFDPADRRHVLARFYRLPESTIRRFYALRMTTGDRIRLVVGRPPRGFSFRARLRSRERHHEIARG